MGPVERWCRVTGTDADGRLLVDCVVEGSGIPDVAVVEVVARLVVAARSLGGAVSVSAPTPAVRELLDLAGVECWLPPG